MVPTEVNGLSVQPDSEVATDAHKGWSMLTFGSRAQHTETFVDEKNTSKTRFGPIQIPQATAHIPKRIVFEIKQTEETVLTKEVLMG
jgi:hypothetical protein